ncbi:hypothetical protein D915_010293 [Fasciola hepatica]|uniref:Uncharacterized protein n=1 Tax=Fasciola hepatica TaxID=6192 RepID=A0A4E0QX40_FASHE|nr:hypothetical protein D915_010293 [Fasciola hepatica]
MLIGYLLSLSDLLNVRYLGFSSISPEGIGLSSSVREVGNLSQSQCLRLADLPVRPCDLFYSIRARHFLNSVLELDWSCGPLSTKRSRIASAFFSSGRSTRGLCFTKATTRRDSAADAPADFISQSTLTCICGLLELRFMWYLSGCREWSSWSFTCTKVESTDSQSEAFTSAQMALTASCFLRS